MKRPGLPPRRTGLRRTAIRRRVKPRAPDDRVSPDLHRHIRVRDGMCFWARVWVGVTMHEGWATYGEAEEMGWHACSDQNGQQHPATAIDSLTVDHFWHDGGHMRDRAPSTREHLVAACHALNDHGMTAVMRRLERAYIAWRTENGTL